VHDQASLLEHDGRVGVDARSPHGGAPIVDDDTRGDVANHMCVEAGTVEPVRKMLWKVVDEIAADVRNALSTTDHFAILALHGDVAFCSRVSGPLRKQLGRTGELAVDVQLSVG
jgi:hypothetical protein